MKTVITGHFKLALIALLACDGDRLAQLSTTHFYTDLDGTLLTDDNQISESDRRAVERYREAGGRIGIATGRLPDSSLPFAETIGADLPLIFANGAVITNSDGGLIRMEGIYDNDSVNAICDRINISSCGSVYVAWGNPKTEEIQLKDDACMAPEDPAFGVLRIRAKHCDEDDPLLDDLIRSYGQKLLIIEEGSGSGRGLSVARKGLGKAEALGYVAERLDIDFVHIGFIGDSGNDTDALKLIHEKGGRCVAMKNGTDGVMAACPRHSERDNNSGGAGDALLDCLD
jgi:HAD superfamily hydrolase (TIGR01484 family)